MVMCDYVIFAGILCLPTPAVWQCCGMPDLKHSRQGLLDKRQWSKTVPELFHYGHQPVRDCKATAQTYCASHK